MSYIVCINAKHTIKEKKWCSLGMGLDANLGNLCPSRRIEGRMELCEITQHNIKQLKLVNSIVFPVTYDDKVCV